MNKIIKFIILEFILLFSLVLHTFMSLMDFLNKSQYEKIYKSLLLVDLPNLIIIVTLIYCMWYIGRKITVKTKD